MVPPVTIAYGSGVNWAKLACIHPYPVHGCRNNASHDLAQYSRRRSKPDIPRTDCSSLALPSHTLTWGKPKTKNVNMPVQASVLAMSEFGRVRRFRIAITAISATKTTSHVVRDSVSASPPANNAAQLHATPPESRPRSCSHAHANTPMHIKVASWLGCPKLPKNLEGGAGRKSQKAAPVSIRSHC